VIRIGLQHINEGCLTIVQHKTRTKLIIPLHPDLQRIIAATPSGNLTLLCTSHGYPFTDAGFGNWFRDACAAAGLPKRWYYGKQPAGVERKLDGRSTRSPHGPGTKH
jgi:hypothetical protein